MPNPSRYMVVPYYDIGMVAYDTYETMNRIQYFIDNGNFRRAPAEANLALLEKIRWHEIHWSQVTFKEMLPLVSLPRNHPRTLGARFFFRSHGVKVDMSNYDREFESKLVEAVEAVEDAHNIWNLYDDGVASEAGTMDTIDDEALQGLMAIRNRHDDSDVLDVANIEITETTDEEITTLLNDAIGEF